GEARARGHATHREGRPKRPPEVEPAAARLSLATGEPRPQPAPELADDVARLLHVAGGELAERELYEREPPRDATAAGFARVPRHLAVRRSARDVARLLARTGAPRRRPLPAPP